VGAPKPAAPPPPPAKPPTAGRPVTAVKPTTAVKSDTSFTGDPNEKVNIYINKTNNPKVHELIGKLHNISAEEAADLANKPLVTVARNISRQQAEIIKKKLAEYRVSARLSAARMSQRTEPEEGGEEEEGA
jgi:ribosomal protein L7/L12